uniref:Ribonuclease H protein At1g65750 family n=1 Tax=Cajanus cajan TaxID=3821 RepID=A0A151SXX7_CAJCA|nr:Putative ribonuclease H protein At1g65750 family [Cajanus cajan]
MYQPSLRRFLWGGVGDQKKVCWISWDKVTLPKEKGGLGVKNIILFNRSLLAKWRWNLFHQSSSMWAQVLQSRYRGGHNLCAQASSQKDSIWWRDLLMVCGGVEEDNWFDKLIEWRVGVGSKVRFWLDKWVGPTNLAVAFPRLFISSDQQLASIAEIGAFVNGEWVWHLRWRRNRFEWEIPLEQQLLRLINSRIFNSSQCDSWSWVAESSGMFSVKSAYQIILAESVTIEDHDIFKLIWSIPAPPKVLFFAWRLLNRGLPTVDNLARRNILLGEHESKCIFCKVDIETTTHIFCTCPMVDRVWKQCLSWLNCPAPLPRQIFDHFSFLPAPIQNESEAETWHTVWLATMWTLWRYRNKCIFVGGTFEQGSIVRDILIFCWRWLSTLKPSFAYSFSQWSSNPGPCICFNGCG